MFFLLGIVYKENKRNFVWIKEKKNWVELYRIFYCYKCVDFIVCWFCKDLWKFFNFLLNFEIFLLRI